ncbi:MAG: DNA-binding protein [Desulfuromonadaceae bacterium]|nr:DNA-binding protein [Desulfuromonadaceae bacterium]
MAFWWDNSRDSVSGLNVAAGFDVNTITTITGTVMTPPDRNRQEQHTLMSVATTQGNVTVVLGPWGFWGKQKITITKNMELSITGSFAQGKDGALYIFAQRIENRSNGETVTLRSESGTPLWSRAGSGNQNGTMQNNGSGPRTGAGNRGGGMRGGRR